jgi:hypothetical protein
LVAGATPAQTDKFLPMSRPVPSWATLRGKYFTNRPILSSTHRLFLADGTPGTTLPLRWLPHSGAHLQSLRPQPALLRRRVCARGACPLRAQSRGALSGESAWSPCPCRTSEAIPHPAGESDASGFPTPGDACSTAGEPNVVCKNRTSAAVALPFLSSAASAIGSYGISAPTGSSSPSNRSERIAP